MKRYAMMAVVCLSAMVSLAEPAEVGKPFPPYTLEDQFGNSASLSNETRVVIVASEKAVSQKVNEWLKQKPADFLPSNRAEYVSDIEPMPGVITALFARPKMKKYPFRLLLATEKSFAATYPAQKGKIAVFLLGDQQVLAEVRYVDTPSEVEALLAAPR